MENERMQKAHALQEAKKPAYQRHDQAIVQAKAIYDQAVAPAQQRYDQVRASALAVYNQVKAKTTNEEEIKAAFEQYNQAVEEAWVIFLQETDKASSERQRANTQAQETLEREIAAIEQAFFGNE